MSAWGDQAMEDKPRREELAVLLAEMQAENGGDPRGGRVGQASPGAVVLDAGALRAFERDDRRVRRLVELAANQGRRLHVPAGVIGQLWRDGARQTRLTRLVRSGVLDVRALHLDEATATGPRAASAVRPTSSTRAWSFSLDAMPSSWSPATRLTFTGRTRS